MPSYTLYYFNHRGRAELSRMLFHLAGVQYNDRRIEMSEWGNMRSKFPCNMLPMLDIDKFQLPQSMSSGRYLAREFGYHGKSNIEMARIDYICDCFYDILDDYLRMYCDNNGRMMFQRGGEMKSLSSERRQRFQETCRRILPYMERTLEKYGGGNQWFMGDRLTMADIMFYCALENPIFEDSNFLRSYPRLLALRTRFQNHPKMSVYFSKRPRTEF